VVHVLFGHVGVVPDYVLLESAGRSIVFDLDDVGSDDTLEPMKDDSSTNPFKRTRPFGPVAQTDGIVVPVRVSESKHQTSGRLETKGINELPAQQTHGGRTQNDDALFVQPDDALIRPEIENLSQVEVLEIDRLGMRCFSHINL
jgi:hypothetical protein